MKKSLKQQAVDYLEYLKEEGITHVPQTVDFPEKSHAHPEQAMRKKTTSTPPPSTPASTGTPPDESQRDFSFLPQPLTPIARKIAACNKCGLAATRTHTVPGQGCLKPDIFFIGEGPGADEDEQGLAFVGRAGQLLGKMITAMGYTRDEVFIGNIVKCRPPGNRVPTPDEMETCMPYLKEQIAIIQPTLIVCLGATAVRGLVGETQGITKVRGQWREFEGIPVMLTYHPAYLLRNPPAKKDVWADLKTVLARLGRTPPPAQKNA